VVADSGGKLEAEAVGYALRETRFVRDTCPTEADTAPPQGVMNPLQRVDECLTGIHSTTRDLPGLAQAGELYGTSPLADSYTSRPAYANSHGLSCGTDRSQPPGRDHVPKAQPRHLVNVPVRLTIAAHPRLHRFHAAVGCSRLLGCAAESRMAV
jgi:hypothetical protein